MGDKIDITFPQAPTFEAHDVDFVHATATPSTQRPSGWNGPWQQPLRLLVIATGYRHQLEVIPGLEVANSAYTITTTLEDAIHAGDGWRRFLADPGPVVVGDWGWAASAPPAGSAALASPVLAAWFKPSAGQPVLPDS